MVFGRLAYGLVIYVLFMPSFGVCEKWAPDIYPFGKGALKVIMKGPCNSLIGIVHNDSQPNTFAFPTGTTAYGQNDSDGNSTFGLYAEARQYANSGVVTNEAVSMNFGGYPSLSLPPDRSIGTLEQNPIALTVAAGGDWPSSIGIHISKEGQKPNTFLTGIYLSPMSWERYGIFIDSGIGTPLVIRHDTQQVGIRLLGSGDIKPMYSAFTYTDASGTNRFAIKQDGHLFFTNTATTSIPPASSINSGWLKIEIDGQIKLIPYFDP